MRALVLFLILANLAFFAWSSLIDAPSPLPNESISGVPRLELLSEARAGGAAAHASGANQAVGQFGERSGDLAIAPSSAAAPRQAAEPGTGSVSDRQAPASAPAAPALNSGAPAQTVRPSSQAGRADPAATRRRAAGDPIASRDPVAAEAGRCVAVGPFWDPHAVSEAAVLLRQHGFDPRPRVAAGSAQPGYWVYIGGLGSQQSAAGALRRLEQHGLSDVRIMPARDGDRRVSVGLFRKRADAERRAGVVRGLGFTVTIEAESGSGTSTAHWIDVDLGRSTNVVPAEALLSLQGVGQSSLTIEQCPSSSPSSSSKALSSKPAMARPLTAEASRPG